jgi:hypothetical protein
MLLAEVKLVTGPKRNRKQHRVLRYKNFPISKANIDRLQHRKV